MADLRLEGQELVETMQYIVVGIGNEKYGIDISYIDNIVRMQKITRVPKAQEFFKGIINLRGEVVPVMGPPITVRKSMSRRPVKATVYDSVKDNGSDYGEINVIFEKIGDGCEAGILKKGENLIIDLGQDMVGRPAFTVKAESGTRIEFLFAELLNDSGLESRGNDYAKGSAYITGCNHSGKNGIGINAPVKNSNTEVAKIRIPIGEMV